MRDLSYAQSRVDAQRPNLDVCRLWRRTRPGPECRGHGEVAGLGTLCIVHDIAGRRHRTGGDTKRLWSGGKTPIRAARCVETRIPREWSRELSLIHISEPTRPY